MRDRKDGDMGRHEEHEWVSIPKGNQVTKLFNKQLSFSFTAPLFYREEKDREVASKRRLGREKKSRRLCTRCVDSCWSFPSSDNARLGVAEH